jgi:hypothetical protein
MSPTRLVPLAALLLAASPVLAQQNDPGAQYELGRLELRSYEQVVAQLGEMGPLTATPDTTTPLNEYSTGVQERWGVFEASGTQLDAFDFAQRVGDTQTLVRLEGEVQRSRSRGWLATGVGVVAMGACAGILTAGARNPDLPDALGTVGAGLGLGGLVGTAAGLRIALAPRRLHGAVDEAWTQTRAQDLIDQHNQALRRELGVEGE